MKETNCFLLNRMEVPSCKSSQCDKCQSRKNQRQSCNFLKCRTFLQNQNSQQQADRQAQLAERLYITYVCDISHCDQNQQVGQSGEKTRKIRLRLKKEFS